MEELRDLLVQNGLTVKSASIVAIVVAILLCLLFGWLLKALLSGPLARYFKTSGPWLDALKRYHVWGRGALTIVVIIAGGMVIPLLDPWSTIQRVVGKSFDGVFVVAFALTVSGLIASWVTVFQTREAGQRLPFKALGQGSQVLVWTYAFVALLSVFTGRDVISVLTGLTALGAVLVYVFRDPLLGWTAGVQIAANDLVRIGDWISFPRSGADGTVEEISLTTVKVRNWNKTVSSLPTYSLFSEGFRNWRGMYESGGRRIKRSIAIDMTSVRFCDESLLRRLEHSPIILELGLKVDSPGAEADPLNEPQLTNLSCFRAWLEAWLKKHPKIHEGMTSMVRELKPDGRGVPVEIYVFSNDQRWEYYEKLQAEIVDHILAVLPVFDLRVFQEPTGKDVRALVDRQRL